MEMAGGMPLGDLVPQLVLVAGAATGLVLAVVVPRRGAWTVAVVALVTLGVSGLAQVAALGGAGRTSFEGLVAVDAGAGWATLAILVSTAVVVVLGPDWFAADARHAEWYVLVLLVALGSSALAVAADLNLLIVALLLASVPGYAVAAYHRAEPASVEAGMKYFLIGALTNPLLLLGAVVVLLSTSTTLMSGLGRLAEVAAPLGVAGVVLVTVGLAFEAGTLPAHAWVPDVAEGAPVPSAALLVVAPKIGALVAIARFVSGVPAGAVAWRPLVAVLAAATMTLGAVAALWQDDLRRLLGWSSVSQAGFALMAVVAVGRSDRAVSALVVFLLAYGLATVAAFAVVGHLRGRTALADYAGLATRRPWLATALTVALLSLVGIPPLVGFIGKLELFLATIDAGYAWLAVLGVVVTVISLVYSLRVIAPVVLGEASGRVVVLGRWAFAAVVIATLATVVGGILAEVLLAGTEGATLVH